MRFSRNLLALCLPLLPASLTAEWTRIGPDGGHVTEIATAPSRPAVVYAGLGTGGVFRSADRGRTWTFAGKGLIDHSIRDLAVDPRNPDRVYAATSDGFLRSADGGVSWRQIADPAGGNVSTVSEVEIHPRQPAVLLAVAYGLGIFRSTNGGRTWTTEPVLPGFVLSLAGSPVRPGVFWAGFAGGGLFKSVDSGRTWTAAGVGLPAGADILKIAADPRAADTLYTVVNGVSGLFKSTDGGATWTPSQNGLGSAQVRRVAVDPENPSTVYALTEFQLFRSLDGGASWTRLLATGLLGRPQTVAPLGFGVLAGTETGLFLSTDQGATWRASQKGLTALSIMSLALDGQDPLRIYAMSYLAGLYKMRKGDASWQRLGAPFGGFTGPIAVHPADPETLYAGAPLHMGKSGNGGRRWTVYGIDPCFHPARIGIDPQDPATLYTSGYHVGSGCFNDPASCILYRSRDAGQTWTCIGGGGLPTSSGGSLLGINPLTSALYTAVGINVWTSKDQGDTWTLLAPDLHVSSFAASPVEEGTLWVGLSGRVAKSRDGGRTWTYSSLGLPGNDSVMHLAPHPTDPAVVYAGTNTHGVYRSADGGATWARLGPWPAGLRLWAGIVLDPRDPSVVYAGTDGAGVLRYEP